MGSENTRTISIIKKDFHNHIREISYTRHLWQAWQDFTEVTALAIVQSTGFSQDREDQYMRTIGKYEPKEIQIFPKLISLTIEALELEYCDFLGQMFMELELGSKWHGQFFTPYNLCKVIAQLTISKDQFKDGQIVTINEPAVGSGAMIIAVCEYLRENNINYQQQLDIIAQDKDYIAFCMSYIQLSLLGCSAKVIYGNTLTLESSLVWQTPIAFLNTHSPIPAMNMDIVAPAINQIVGCQSTLENIGADL